ncbi:MAG: AAA family ATPase [Agriterribacter sp.]
MSFLQTFSVNAAKKAPFPFNIPAVQFAKDVNLGNAVTIFAGDNGCGKSTLLEALAMSVKLPLIGGYIQPNDGFEAAGLLQPYIELKWNRQINKGFFFRAEDFSDFINSVENERNKIAADLRDLQGVVDDAIIRQMSDSANYSLRHMRKDYGENMQAFSHGEAYLKILQTRIAGQGIYLLDEPEAALSPLKQLSLMAFILEVLKENKSQFIIATHSPILMGIPGACIYEILETGLQKTAYKDTDHYRITKTFLDNPDFYLRHF